MPSVNLGRVRGRDGITPTIVENPGNTDDSYKLDITSGNDSFTTPNLKPPKGYDIVVSTTIPIEVEPGIIVMVVESGVEQ